ncbi:MAG TPA: LysR family transcriptional regulator [Steroidobacteraceae bacterium]|nr:LysR family transcriptional regulator [Steroidobacteraceae bacterium]
MTSNQPDWDDRIGRRLKLRDLHVLAEVVRCGSMAKAGSHLAMSQPAVSEAISSLERAVGIRLLDRHAQGVVPTIYAEVLIRRARAVFDELRQGVREIEFLSDPTVGEVRIACPEFVAAGLLPRAIASFRERYPRVTFQVVHQDTTTLRNQELQDRVVDIVLSRVPDGFKDDDLNVESLFDDHHWIIAGLKNPWVRRRKISLEQLADEAWILPPSPVIFNLLNSAFQSRGARLSDVSVTSASLLLRSELLGTGRFISVMHASILEKNSKIWGLRRLNVDVDLRSPPISLVTLKKRAPGPVVQRFIEHLREISVKSR